MCINKILEEANLFHINTKRLRELSPYYPEIYYEIEDDNNIVASTIIRKQHDSEWYDIHLVKRNDDLERLKDFTHAEAYKIILFYIVSPTYVNNRGEKINKLSKTQISEKERLMPYIKNLTI